MRLTKIENRLSLKYVLWFFRGSLPESEFLPRFARFHLLSEKSELPPLYLLKSRFLRLFVFILENKKRRSPICAGSQNRTGYACLFRAALCQWANPAFFILSNLPARQMPCALGRNRTYIKALEEPCSIHWTTRAYFDSRKKNDIVSTRPRGNKKIHFTV